MKSFSLFAAKLTVVALAVLCVGYTAVSMFQKSAIGQAWAYQQGRMDLITEIQKQQAAQQSVTPQKNVSQK